MHVGIHFYPIVTFHLPDCALAVYSSMSTCDSMQAAHYSYLHGKKWPHSEVTYSLHDHSFHHHDKMATIHYLILSKQFIYG